MRNRPRVGALIQVKRNGQNRWHVFVTRPIAEPAIRRLAQVARVDLWDSEMPPPRRELLARTSRAGAVLSMVTDRFDSPAIESLPKLRVISNFAVGVDNIDLVAATRAGVAVGHTPGVLTETTADLSFALLMTTARRVAEGDRYTRSGRWRTWGPKILLGNDVHGATLGIIGWGAIGRAMASRASGFAMRVLYIPGPNSRRSSRNLRRSDRERKEIRGAQPVSLKRLLAESDFVSLHVPLTPSTFHMIGAAEFSMMKRSAILINTARGPIVDQAALASALRAGRIAAAGFDVTEPEPIDPGDPLLRMSNVVITPHIGSASHATRLKMAEVAVDNLINVIEGGLPKYCANPAVRLRWRGSQT
jgi:glyoxylate reductase